MAQRVYWSDRPEQVVMSLEQWRMRCPDCGTRDVAVSTWQRLVEFPDIIWQHPNWPLPLEAHVCWRAKPAPITHGVDVPEL